MQRAISLLRAWMIAGTLGTVRYWLLHAFLVSRLAQDPLARLKVMVLVSLMPVLDKLPWQRAYHVRLSYKGLDVDWQIMHKSDTMRLQEILISGCYDDVPVTNPSVILDVGSNAGVSLLHFRATHPQARLVGIEPNALTFPRLRANAANLGTELHQLAVAPTDGPMTLFLIDSPGQSSLDSSTGGQALTVEGRTLDSLVTELGLEKVDLLKIDIEGGEFAAFRNSRRLHDVTAIIGEFHDDGDPGGRDVLFAMLKDFDIEVREDFGDRGIFVAVRQTDRAGIT